MTNPNKSGFIVVVAVADGSGAICVIRSNPLSPSSRSFPTSSWPPAINGSRLIVVPIVNSIEFAVVVKGLDLEKLPKVVDFVDEIEPVFVDTSFVVLVFDIFVLETIGDKIVFGIIVVDDDEKFGTKFVKLNVEKDSFGKRVVSEFK